MLQEEDKMSHSAANSAQNNSSIMITQTNMNDETAMDLMHPSFAESKILDKDEEAFEDESSQSSFSSNDQKFKAKSQIQQEEPQVIEQEMEVKDEHFEVYFNQKDVIGLFTVQSLAKGHNLCLQFLIGFLFLIYILFEALTMGSIYGINRVIDEHITRDLGAIQDVDGIVSWLDMNIETLYTDEKHHTKDRISAFDPHDVEDGEVDFNPPEFEEDELAEYATFLGDKSTSYNYYAGMSIATVSASLISTEEGLNERVIPYKRQEEYRLTQNNFQDANTTWSDVFEYDEDLAEYEGALQQHFKANMSLSDARTKFSFMKDNGWFAQDMVMTIATLQFYNAQLELGTVYKYKILQTNIKEIDYKREVQIFFPNNRRLPQTRPWAITLVSLMIFILTIVSLINFSRALSKKIRAKCTSPNMNAGFILLDIQMLFQYAIMIYLFLEGMILFFKYWKTFSIPYADEEQFEVWINWSKEFRVFRLWIGLMFVLMTINFISIAATKLPSLNILFDTLSSAAKDIFGFTFLMFLCLCQYTALTYVFFGDSAKYWSGLKRALVMNYQQMIGVLNYSQMYEANPYIAGLIFVGGIFFFSFVAMNMYTAMVLRTYSQMRGNKFFIAEAMAKILLSHFKRKAWLWINLFTCRVRKSKEIKENQEQSIAEKFNKNTFKDVFTHNWAQIFHAKEADHERTLEEFTKKFHETAKQMLIERRQHEMRKVEMISVTNARKSFKQLKKGCIYMAFIIVTVIFFFKFSNVSWNFKATLAIAKGLQEGPVALANITTFSDIKDYAHNQLTVSNLEANAYSTPAGQDIMRIGVRLYKEKLNEEKTTAAIFPTVIQGFELDSNYGTSKRTLQEKIVRAVLNTRDQEVSRDLTVKDGFNMDLNYTEPMKFIVGATDYLGSANGDGGYVLTISHKPLDEREKTIQKLEEILAYDWEKFGTLGQINIEQAQLLVNYDAIFYSIVAFHFRANGEVLPEHQWIILSNHHTSPVTLTFFTIYVLFVCFYNAKLFGKFHKIWSSMTAKEIQKLKKNPNYKSNTSRRSCPAKAISYIGIEWENLEHKNKIRKFTDAIYYIIVNIIIKTWKTVRMVYTYCRITGYNLFNLITLFLHLLTIIDICRIFMHDKSPDEQIIGGLAVVSYYRNGFQLQAACTLFFMSIQLLEFTKFSIWADLPNSVLYEGKWDFLNCALIFTLIMFAEAISGWLTFGLALPEFQDVHYSLYQVLKIINGGSGLFDRMYEIEYNWAVVFFVLTTVTHYFLFVNIFFAMIQNNYRIQHAQLVTLSEKAEVSLMSVLYSTISRHYIQSKHRAAIREQNRQESYLEKKCCCKRVWPDKTVDEMFREEPKQTCAYRFFCCFKRRSECCRRILDSWLHKQRKAEMVKEIQSIYDLKLAKSYIDTKFQRFDEQLQKDPDVQQIEETKKQDQIAIEKVELHKGIMPYIQQFEQKNSEGGLLNLNKHWRHIDTHELTNTNFWIFHLEENIQFLTKKKISLYDYRRTSSIFQPTIILKIDKSDFAKQFRTKPPYEQKKVLKDSKVPIQIKYQCWKALDQVKYLQHDGVINTVMKLCQHKEDGKGFPLDDMLQINFFDFKETSWRLSENNSVSSKLCEWWKRCLTVEEQFCLWYNYFTSKERVRLWNTLTFSTAYFTDAIVESRFSDKAGAQDFRREDVRRMIDYLEDQMYMKGAKEEHAILGHWRHRAMPRRRITKEDKQSNLSAEQIQRVKDEVYNTSQMRKLWHQLLLGGPGEMYDAVLTQLRQDRGILRDPNEYDLIDDTPSKNALTAKVPSPMKVTFKEADKYEGGSTDPANLHQSVKDRAKHTWYRFQQVRAMFRSMLSKSKEILHKQKSKVLQQKSGRKLSRLEKFRLLVSQGHKDDYRVPLWMLMKKSEKLDMLCHQFIDDEAQLMAWLIETEYGALKKITGCTKRVDKLLTDAFDQQIFRKYLTLSQLQAALNSNKYCDHRLRELQVEDKQLFKYSKFLKQKLASLDYDLQHKTSEFYKVREQSNMLKEHLEGIMDHYAECGQDQNRLKTKHKYTDEEINHALTYALYQEEYVSNGSENLDRRRESTLHKSDRDSRSKAPSNKVNERISKRSSFRAPTVVSESMFRHNMSFNAISERTQDDGVTSLGTIQTEQISSSSSNRISLTSSSSGDDSSSSGTSSSQSSSNAGSGSSTPSTPSSSARQSN